MIPVVLLICQGLDKQYYFWHGIKIGFTAWLGFLLDWWGTKPVQLKETQNTLDKLQIERKKLSEGV